MTWKLAGDIYECCSCKVMCRCTLGPAEPDQEWCSALQIYVINAGDADGVDLAGARLGLALELPGDFFGGIDRARLYFDEATTNDAQRKALEEIYQGRAGGHWVSMQEAIGEWLPSQVAAISLEPSDDGINGAISGAAELQLEYIVGGDGRRAAIENAPVAGAMGITTVELASATGSRGTDPNLRQWESLGHGGHSPFNWQS